MSLNSNSQIVIYTRPGCCLCDDAIDLLHKHGLQPKMLDIDADPVLQEKFHTCVPVVEIDGVVRFRGKLNEVLLKRLIGK